MYLCVYVCEIKVTLLVTVNNKVLCINAGHSRRMLLGKLRAIRFQLIHFPRHIQRLALRSLIAAR